MTVEVQVTLELTISVFNTGEIAEIIINNMKQQVENGETVKHLLQRIISEDAGTKEVFQETLAESMRI